MTSLPPDSSRSAVNFIDKLAAGFVMIITPEYPQVKDACQRSQEKQRPLGPVPVIKPVYKTIDGVKIRYAQGGNPNGETLVLLSQLPQSILAFDSIWQRLSPDFNLIAIDLPGFGRSEGGEIFYDLCRTN